MDICRRRKEDIMKTFVKGDNIQKLNGRSLSKFTFDTSVEYRFVVVDTEMKTHELTYTTRAKDRETHTIIKSDLVKASKLKPLVIGDSEETGKTSGSVYYLYTDEIPSIARAVSDDKESKELKACDNYRTLTKAVYISADGKLRINAPKGVALTFEGFNTDFEYTEETRYYGLMADDITAHGMTEDSVIHQANAERQTDDE